MSTIQKQVNVSFDIEIERIYLKEVSFKVHNTPRIFALKWRPEMQLNFKTYHNEMEENVLEVVLCVDLEGKLERNTVVEIRLEQAGVFRVNANMPDSKRDTVPALCMTTLFPYAREAIDNLASKGSLPPFLVGVFDFDKLLKTAMAEVADVQTRFTGKGSEVLN